MDVDDDDEYMNAAAAHVAFVMTVSAASMYWLLRHAQHTGDINIHKVHPLTIKNRLRLCRFSAQWNRLHRNSRVHSVIDFVVNVSQNFSERALLFLKNSIRISITTSSSAIVEGPRDALSQLKSCQLLHSCTKNHI